MVRNDLHHLHKNVLVVVKFLEQSKCSEPSSKARAPFRCVLQDACLWQPDIVSTRHRISDVATATLSISALWPRSCCLRWRRHVSNSFEPSISPFVLARAFWWLVAASRTAHRRWGPQLVSSAIGTRLVQKFLWWTLWRLKHGATRSAKRCSNERCSLRSQGSQSGLDGFSVFVAGSEASLVEAGLSTELVSATMIGAPGCASAFGVDPVEGFTARRLTGETE